MKKRKERQSRERREIRDSGGWWLSGWCGSVAKHWRLKPGAVGLMTVHLFTFLYFHLML